MARVHFLAVDVLSDARCQLTVADLVFTRGVLHTFVADEGGQGSRVPWPRAFPSEACGWTSPAVPIRWMFSATAPASAYRD
jgi:hypothetical protein